MKTKTLIVFLITLIFFTGCQKKASDIKTMYVTSETDVEIKEKPDAKSKTIETIPFGDSVNLLETKGKEITENGIKGVWNKVNWNQKTEGWIFGVLSDTRPDDTSIFDNLTTRINNSKEGDTIEIASGIFNIDEKNGFILKDIKERTIKPSIDSARVEFTTGSETRDIITIKNCNNLILSGIYVYFNTETSNASCINIGNSKNITIENCDIGNSKFGIFAENNNSGIKIVSNSFHNSTETGLYYSSNKGTVSGNTFYDNTQNMYIDENIKYSIEIAENNEYPNTTVFNNILGEYSSSLTFSTDNSEENESENSGQTSMYNMSISKSDYTVSIQISSNNQENSFNIQGNISDFTENEAGFGVKLTGYNGEEYDMTISPFDGNSSINVMIHSYKNLNEDDEIFLNENLGSSGLFDSFYRNDIPSDGPQGYEDGGDDGGV